MSGRTDGPGDEIAPAIRAAPVKHFVGAGPAERAFKRAYPGVGAVRRQVRVAAFAIRAQLEQGFRDLRRQYKPGLRTAQPDNARVSNIRRYSAGESPVRRRNNRRKNEASS